MTYPNLMELMKKHPRSAMWSFNGMYGFKKDGKYHWYGLNKSNQWTFRKKTNTQTFTIKVKARKC